MEVLATAIRQEIEIEGTQFGKEEIILSLFADDLIVYIENPTDSNKKLLNLISDIGKKVGYKFSTLKSKAFWYTNNGISETEMRKNPICCSNKKNKVLRNKPNQGGKRHILRKEQNIEEKKSRKIQLNGSIYSVNGLEK